jgi:transposase
MPPPAISPVTHEFINDLPVLMHLMHKKLCLDEALDQERARHGNWQGLSLGQVMVTWLMHILSEHNHFMNHVQEWASHVPQTLAGLWGQALRPTDLTDDRLAEVVRVLSLNEVWHPLERRVNHQMIRAYALPVQQVRLDTTTASVYGGDELSVLFQRGHSKDHRPDLRQFKAMLAALDPLGVLVGVDVVAGNQADDGLYVPILMRLRTTLPPQGLLYIGDCKMGALATRAYIQSTHNWYLMPLAQVGSVPEDLASWVAAAVKGKVKLTPIRDADGKKHLGQAYELKRRLTAQIGTDTLKWVERVLIVRSDSYTKAAVRGLHQRLTHAERDLRALTPPRGRGQRQFTEAAPLQAAVQAILQRYEVDGLLKVQLQPEVERQTVRAYAASPAHVVERTRYRVTVQKNQARIRTQEELLGWRVYVTNAPLARLSLPHAIQAYRDEWLVERDCARLKGRPLSLRPVWLSRDDHAVGLTRLLTLAARVLALAEYQVRRKLADEQRSLDHLYAGQPTRRTAAPTTERLLKAFDHIVLTLIQKGKRIQYHLTPLSDLQRTILRDLECPRQLYQQWIPKSWKLLKI